jgi:ubiquinone/menaquinone biosynthesis C-methylase UbiE
VEWYEIAFDRIYSVLYRHRDDDEAEIVLDAFGDLIAGRDPVLDLACGNGRYMVSADKRDLRTWGVDLSEFLLGEAAKRDGLSGRLVRADMRRLPFGNGVFGAVLNMFTSFGYFDVDMDNLLVLREVSRVLRTGGMLLLDYVNTERVRSKVLEDTMREINGWVVRESRSLQSNGRYLVKGVEAQNAATGETVAYDERVRMYTQSELTTMLESVSLGVSGVFGDYDRSIYNEEFSERIIMICEKR